MLEGHQHAHACVCMCVCMCVCVCVHADPFFPNDQPRCEPLIELPRQPFIKFIILVRLVQPFISSYSAI